MYINYSEYSDIGGRRKNEDMVQIVSYPRSTIVLVADGLGGYGDGDVASRLAVNMITESIRDGAASQTLMEKAIYRANETILARHESGSDMKTTIAAVWFNEEQACVAYVGDSRIYQFRNGEIHFQSTDHSVSQLAALVGEITPDQIRHHCDRNRLTRALGSGMNIKVDTRMLDVQPGDAFLLCSDGFWELIWENEMIADLRVSSCAEAWLSAMRRRVESRLKADSDNNTAAAIIIPR